MEFAPIFEPQLRNPGLVHLHVWFYRHSRPEQVLGILTFFEYYFDGDSLDDLDVVSGGVFGRQQAIARAAGAAYVEHMSFVGAPVGINENLYGSARLYISELSFLEIGRHPDILTVERDDTH